MTPITSNIHPHFQRTSAAKCLNAQKRRNATPTPKTMTDTTCRPYMNTKPVPMVLYIMLYISDGELGRDWGLGTMH